jgi:hypothetical protein
VARTLTVEILGNAQNFAKELDRAAGKTRQLGKVAGVAGLAIASGLAYGLEKSVKAAMAGQVSQASLDTALRNTHQSLKAMAPALDAAEAASRKLGFADDDTRTALARLETATGNTRKAVLDLGLAEDVARIKHTDLDTATKLITGTLAGNTRAAKQLGISIQAVTPNMDALRAKYAALGEAIPVADAAQARFLDKQATGAATLQAVTDKVHGQAQAFADTAAGGMAQFHAQIQHVEESLGNLLLPAVRAVAVGLADLTAWVSAHGPEISAVFQQIWAEVQPVLVQLKDLIVGVSDAIRNNWGTIGPIVEQVGAVIRIFVDNVRLQLKLITDLIHGDWSSAWGDVKHIVSNALAVVKIVMDDYVNILGAVAAGIGHGIVAGFESAVGALGSAANAAGLAILHGFESALGQFAAMLERLIKAPLNAIIGAWDSIALDFTLPSINIPGIGKMGGQHVGFSVPQIPTLDTGAIVTGPTLALLAANNRPEAVVPLGRATPALAGGGATVNYTLNFPNYLGDENQLATHMIRMLQKHAASGPAGSPYRTY